MYVSVVPLHPTDKGSPIMRPLILPPELEARLAAMPSRPITDQDRWRLDCTYIDSLKNQGLLPYDAPYPEPPRSTDALWRSQAMPREKVEQMIADRKAKAKLSAKIKEEKSKDRIAKGKSGRKVLKDKWRSENVQKLVT